MAFTYNTVGVSGFSGASNGSITATYSSAFTPGQAIYRNTGSYSYVNTGGYHTYIFYSTGSITF